MNKQSAFINEESDEKIVKENEFPKNINLKKTWLSMMKRQNWQPTSSSVLCSKHFEAHLIDRSGFRSVLKSGAIPTIFNSLQDQENIPTLPQTGGSAGEDLAIHKVSNVQPTSKIHSQYTIWNSTGNSKYSHIEEKLKELKRKRNRERQRAYYHRQKELKKNEKKIKKIKERVPKSNAERQRIFRQRRKRQKLDSNEENVVQCRAENIENVTLQENQFHSQQLQIYEQRNECITSEVILHRNTGIPGDAYVHEGVLCQECNGSIVKFRYTCLQCDYDICSSCEALGAHALHYVLRMPGLKSQDDVEEILQKIRDSLPPQSRDPDEEPMVHAKIKHELPDPLKFEIEEKYDGRWPHTDNEMEHTLLTLKVEPDLLEEPSPGPQELRTGPQTLEIEYQQHQLQPVSQELEQRRQQTEPVVIKQELEPEQQQLKPTQPAINESTPQFKATTSAYNKKELKYKKEEKLAIKCKCTE